MQRGVWGGSEREREKALPLQNASTILKNHQPAATI